MFAARRTIVRTAMILGIAGAVAAPSSALAADSPAAGSRLKAPSVELTKSMKRSAVKADGRLSKSDRRAMRRTAGQVGKTKEPRGESRNRLGSGGVVDWGCTDWFVSEGAYQAYCVYVFGDGSVGVDWYLAGYGYYWTDWYV